jgi:hypothetical protein
MAHAALLRAELVARVVPRDQAAAEIREVLLGTTGSVVLQLDVNVCCQVAAC